MHRRALEIREIINLETAVLCPACYDDGPRSDPHDGRIVPNFVTQALAHQPITVYGEGRQTRSLCYVSDLVDGIMRAMLADGTAGEVYNLGNPDEHTVLEFAQIVKGLTGSPSPIVHVEPISPIENAGLKLLFVLPALHLT